jgi:chromosomal replication initiation ATPase DnaA
MQVPRQLALSLAHDESLAREDFLVGESNAAALTLIERWPDWPAYGLVLVGPESSGKSHLAAIWATNSGARLISARALNEVDVPATLATGALVVEDLSPGEFSERTLFHILNLAREQAGFVLLTARSQPSPWSIDLPDLASRLRALPSVTLAPPDDALLRGVLIKQFADRQLAVDDALISYLVTRIERSFGAARAAIERLDREALRRKRPLSRALAGELFRDQGDLFNDSLG